jgi:hypothetical protein
MTLSIAGVGPAQCSVPAAMVGIDSGRHVGLRSLRALLYEASTGATPPADRAAAAAAVAAAAAASRRWR